MPVATQRGGAEATLLHALRHAPKEVSWLVAFLEDGPMVETVRSLEVQALVIPAGRVRDGRRLVQATRQLGRAVRGWRADVVVSWMSKAHLYAAPVAKLLDIPALWFQHGLPSARDPIDRMVTLLPARVVLAPSHTVARAQESLWPHRRTHVAYPGVELDQSANDSAIAPRERLSEVGVPPEAPVIGIVGRLQRWKGVHVLIEALPRILASHAGAHAVVVGGDHPLEPGYRQELERLARELGLAHRVHLVGYQADGQAWMRGFDVVVHASDNEPFGLVVLEAMALGKPLVAGAHGGPAEVVRDGVDGFLVDFGDREALAERVVRYLDDPRLAQRMGAAAARRARDFSTTRFANSVADALRAA
jgi:glycosyltransferase involved in cell wall biosynthesis